LTDFFATYPRLRWLAVLMAVLLLLGIGALVWHQLQPRAASQRVAAVAPSAPAPATAVPTAVTQPDGATSPGAASPPATAPTAASTPTPPVPYPEAEVAAAQDVATKFLVALESYRYDDPPSATGNAVRPYVTDKLDQELSNSSSGAAGGAKRASVHEVASASVVGIDCELGCVSTGPLGFIGRVQQHIHTDVGDHDEAGQVETIMTKTPAGWRVADVKV